MILPITDPCTVHHGALGSFASVHLPQGADRAAVAEALRALDGTEVVADRQEAVERYAHLPHMGAKASQLGAPQCSPDVWDFSTDLRSACIRY